MFSGAVSTRKVLFDLIYFSKLIMPCPHVLDRIPQIVPYGLVHTALCPALSLVFEAHVTQNHKVLVGERSEVQVPFVQPNRGRTVGSCGKTVPA